MAAYNYTAAVIGTGYIGTQHIEALKNIVSDIVFCNCLEMGVFPERCLPEDSLKSLEIIFAEFNSVSYGKEIRLGLQQQKHFDPLNAKK